MKALLIPADETKGIRVVEAAGLADLQALVGGYIETVPFRHNIAPYFNEEGKFMGLPYNERATLLLRDTGSLMGGDFGIVGDCVFLGFDASTGKEHDVPEDFVTEVMG